MLDLKDKVTKIPLVGPFYAQRLEKLNIFTIEDLLLHVPTKYLDFRKKTRINLARVGETVVIRGKVNFIKNQYTKGGKKIQIAKVEDESGEITVIWFNQPYLIRTIYKDDTIQLAGEIGWFGRQKAMVSPEYEKIQPGKELSVTEGLIPIYPETAGVSSKWLKKRIASAYNLVSRGLEEFLPTLLLEKEGFPEYKDAVAGIHFPRSYSEAANARKRLAFNELLFLQLKNLYRKIIWQKGRTPFQLKVNAKKVDAFTSNLPFDLTPSQKRSVAEILADLKKDTPMNRLLEGDVGSGKTVVAAITAFVNFLNGFQTVIMVPTQILASQHYHTLKALFKKYKLRLTLVTSGKTVSDEGSTDIYIGTHALLHKRSILKNTTLVIIDEQHMFGVKQRSLLVKKSEVNKFTPHVLTMTATPIPRTVALTFYGDLDLSTLDELPSGRIPTTTWIVPPVKRKKAYAWISEKLKNDKVQTFVICPLIEESEVETMKEVKAAKEEFHKLKKVFNKFKVDLLHGKQKMAEKNKIIQKFGQGKTDILVATSVVEVGIDIPNANIMIVEGAERFGLAALHQLRGRVGRGDKKSYCLLFTENPSLKVTTRLKALQKEKSGFKLAEIDLRLRGPGEVFGLRQHGFPEIKIASWQDTALIKKARGVASEALKNRKKYAALNRLLESFTYSSN